MAARINRLRHDDETRKRIKAIALIDRAQAFAFGEIDMSRDQAWALFRLLDKVLPNLSNVEHSGDADNPVEHVIKWKSSNTSSTMSQDNNSQDSTKDDSASPASSPTDEPERL